MMRFTPKSAPREPAETPFCHRFVFRVFLPALWTLMIAQFVSADTAVKCSIEEMVLSATVVAQRLSGEITLDGELKEEVWQTPSAAPLVQNDPDNACPPKQDTDWWIAYDDEALYLACRMFDAAPESIISGVGRRDSNPVSDWVYLNLDTFNDDRNGYSFSISPAGAINDAILYNDGINDNSWDGIWECATSVDDIGWVAEARIPFSQLSFPDRHDQVWGVNFSRRTIRYQERDELFHRPRGASGYVGRFPDLVGISGVVPGKRMEILAYGAGRTERLNVDEDDPFRDGSEYMGEVGGDLKWALSNDLTLNATFNPDFGQVEVDPAVVNLSDFETYFPERRPFFVKDANTFRFGREGTNNNWNFNWMDPMPLYSRRIGRGPTLSIDDNDHADIPEVTTILGAGKMSGKIGKTNVGFLNAVTAREKADLIYEGVRSRQTVEPLTNYSVLRLQRVRSDGKRGIGLMGTNVTRDLTGGESKTELARTATTAGVDGWTTLDDDHIWALRGYFSASRVAGEATAIDDIQRSSKHYFQRPEADHIDYDTTRTMLDGWCSRLMLNKESGNWTINTSVGAVSPGYEISDLGFQARSDKLNTHMAVSRRWLEPTDHFRSRHISLFGFQGWDFNGRTDNSGYGTFVNATFSNYWSAGMDLWYHPERNGLWTTRGGPALRLPAHRSMFFFGETDARKKICIGGSLHGWDIADGSVGGGTDLWTHIRPKDSVLLTINPHFYYGHDKVGWVGSEKDSSMTATYGSRYIFADMVERRFSLVTRVDWAFTPKLTLQAYLQPLFATGTYRDLRELSKPNSYEFDVYGEDNGSTIEYDTDEGEYRIDPDGSGPMETITTSDPDFNFKSLKVNMVLRWEFRPGSTFFLVWTQNRTDEADPGDFELRRDMRSLIKTDGEDIIMFKVATWL